MASDKQPNPPPKAPAKQAPPKLPPANLPNQVFKRSKDDPIKLR
jgi:hypothetical protein